MSETVDWKSVSQTYRSALLQDVIPFWEKFSPDREAGGYLTCLDRQGRVYDTDKFMWLQGRQVWMFSKLYNVLEKRPAWLDLARHGADFMRRHGRDSEGNWYFSLNRQGTPLIQPYNIFSDCFAAMAFSQYALASGDDEARSIARQTLDNILQRQANPKGRYNKSFPGTRPLTSLVLPMILCNLALEMEWMLDPATLDQILDSSLAVILGKCLDRKRLLLHEAVNPDGSPADCFEGRMISPGHGIEAAWFVMDIAARRGDKVLINQCIDIALSLLQYGWDPVHGGLFYFRDCEDRPQDRLDWDQKLWWVHLESLVAFAKGYALTGRSDCAEAFARIHAYAWARFPDPQYGEWFGYLNRQGEVLVDAKGGKWKGCFHVPRAFWLVSQAAQDSAQGRRP
jgi:N-acylglucosamine 2-epimerase